MCVCVYVHACTNIWLCCKCVSVCSHVHSYNVFNTRFFHQSVNQLWTWSSYFLFSQLIIVCGWQFENLLAAVYYIWKMASKVCYSLQSCMLLGFCLKALIHTFFPSLCPFIFFTSPMLAFSQVLGSGVNHIFRKDLICSCLLKNPYSAYD